MSTYLLNKIRESDGVFYCSNCKVERPLEDRVILHTHAHRCKVCNEKRLKVIKETRAANLKLILGLKDDNGQRDD